MSNERLYDQAIEAIDAATSQGQLYDAVVGFAETLGAPEAAEIDWQETAFLGDDEGARRVFRRACERWDEVPPILIAAGNLCTFRSQPNADCKAFSNPYQIGTRWYVDIREASPKGPLKSTVPVNCLMPTRRYDTRGLRPVMFEFDYPGCPTFHGYTSDVTWNGFLVAEVDEHERRRLVEHFSGEADHEPDPDDEEDVTNNIVKLSNGLYVLDGLTPEEVTQEELDARGQVPTERPDAYTVEVRQAQFRLSKECHAEGLADAIYKNRWNLIDICLRDCITATDPRGQLKDPMTIAREVGIAE